MPRSNSPIAEKDLSRPTVSLLGVGGFVPFVNPLVPAGYEGVAANVGIMLELSSATRGGGVFSGWSPPLRATNRIQQGARAKKGAAREVTSRIAQSLGFSGFPDHPAINDDAPALDNQVAQLNSKIRDGNVQLKFEGARGYLRSVLDALRTSRFASRAGADFAENFVRFGVKIYCLPSKPKQAANG
jgi:hypothetical protein